MDAFAGYISNLYLQAASSEKHCILCEPDFGINHEVNRALIVRPVHGDEAMGRDFSNHLRSCVSFLDFKTFLADPNL